MNNEWLDRKKEREATKVLNKQTTKNIDSLVTQWKSGTDKVRIGLMLHDIFHILAGNILQVMGSKFFSQYGTNKELTRVMMHQAIHALTRMKPKPKNCFNCFTTVMLTALRTHVAAHQRNDCGA